MERASSVARDETLRLSSPMERMGGLLVRQGDPGANGLFMDGLTCLKKDEAFFVRGDATDVGLAKGLSFDAFMFSRN